LLPVRMGGTGRPPVLSFHLDGSRKPGGMG
jgi:hypothetical protein